MSLLALAWRIYHFSFLVSAGPEAADLFADSVNAPFVHCVHKHSSRILKTLQEALAIIYTCTLKRVNYHYRFRESFGLPLSSPAKNASPSPPARIRSAGRVTFLAKILIESTGTIHATRGKWTPPWTHMWVPQFTVDFTAEPCRWIIDRERVGLQKQKTREAMCQLIKIKS